MFTETIVAGILVIALLAGIAYLHFGKRQAGNIREIAEVDFRKLPEPTPWTPPRPRILTEPHAASILAEPQFAEPLTDGLEAFGDAGNPIFDELIAELGDPTHTKPFPVELSRDVIAAEFDVETVQRRAFAAAWHAWSPENATIAALPRKPAKAAKRTRKVSVQV